MKIYLFLRDFFLFITPCVREVQGQLGSRVNTVRNVSQHQRCSLLVPCMCTQSETLQKHTQVQHRHKHMQIVVDFAVPLSSMWLFSIYWLSVLVLLL